MDIIAREKQLAGISAIPDQSNQTGIESISAYRFCTSSFRIFCATCRSARKYNLFTFSRHQKSAFAGSGFGNWKKALQRFNKHAKSDCIERSQRSEQQNVVEQIWLLS